MSDKLSEEEIKERLSNLKIWGIENKRLVTRIEFADFKESVFFANQVFSLAEREFHHPEVKVEYGAVEIDLWSHDADRITERDLEMAEKIEKIVSDTKWS